MKITSNGTPAATPVAAPAPAAPAVLAPAASTTAVAVGASAAGALLRSARAQLKQMPEVDAAKVAQVREALERGEIPFDAGKLAQLITRYHGSHG
jgi:negative regulator of flagellin synthesis FlgM